MDKAKIISICSKIVLALLAIVVVVAVLLSLRYKSIVVQSSIVILDVWNGDIYELGEYRFNLKRHKDMDIPPDEAVTGVITYPEYGCSDEFPLGIRLTNHTKRIVYNTGWQLRARKDYRSFNYVMPSDRNRYSDWIIEPLSTADFCSKMPKLNDEDEDIESLIWELKITDVEYK